MSGTTFASGILQSPRRRLRILALGWVLGGASGALAGGTPIYVSKSGQDSNNGNSPQSAVQTVGKGLTLAGAQGGAEVRVSIGKYDEPALRLPANVSLTGGWDLTFTPEKRKLFTNSQLSRLTPDQDLCSDHTCLTTSQADRVLTLSNAGTSVSQLVVLGPDRSKASDDSSYGVIVDGADATLDFVVVKTGNGGTGVTGSKGQSGTGYCTSGGAPGHVTFTSPTNCSLNQWGISTCHGQEQCSSADGGAGQSVSASVQGGKGGGSASPQFCPYDGAANSAGYDDRHHDGGQGGNGDDGAQGAAGLPKDPTLGSFGRAADGTHELSWKGDPPDPSATGQAGTPGAGGGGGGPGASYAYAWFMAGEGDAIGGDGGTGGRGGCPSAGGTGGDTGGGAFGVVVANARLSSAALAVFGGVGGTGGVGGDGGPVTPGESQVPGFSGIPSGYFCRGSGTAQPQAPSCGGCTSNCCNVRCAGGGGWGGLGGHGGAGGGGAGGNGGVAVKVATLGSGHLNVTGTFRLVGGAGGTAGTGGQGGADATRALSGNAGPSKDEVAIPLK